MIIYCQCVQGFVQQMSVLSNLYSINGCFMDESIAHYVHFMDIPLQVCSLWSLPYDTDWDNYIKYYHNYIKCCYNYRCMTIREGSFMVMDFLCFEWSVRFMGKKCLILGHLFICNVTQSDNDVNLYDGMEVWKYCVWHYRIALTKKLIHTFYDIFGSKFILLWQVVNILLKGNPAYTDNINKTIFSTVQKFINQSHRFNQ